jgi:thiamine-phosphate pyrophosphorylase
MKSYLITDPSIYTNNPKKFEEILTSIINKNNIDYICFRDKISSNYKELAKILIKISIDNNINNIYINTHINLAKQLNAKGVHLNSQQFSQIQYAQSLNLKVIISCHCEDDIKKAIKHDLDYITYSPIFNTPNKGQAKGLEHLMYIQNKYPKVKIFALGGIISEIHINQIKQTHTYGFASIRYFNT